MPTTPTSSDAGIFNVQRKNVIVTLTGSGTDDYRLLVQIQNYVYSIYSLGISGSYNGPNITAALPLGINY